MSEGEEKTVMKYLFYGLLLLFFDINLNLGFSIINVLPDFVGYALIAYGMSRVADCKTYQRSRGLVKIAVAVDVVLWLIAIFGLQSNWVIGSICSVVSILFKLMVTWKIVLGVQEMELLHQMDLNGAKLKRIWQMELCFTIGACLTGMLGMALLWIFFCIVNLAVSIAYLVLFYHAKGWMEP